MNAHTPSIGVVFITHHAARHLPRCLPPFLQSPLKPRVLVVNSSSDDGTVELARKLGAETLIVPRSSFNHGSTREEARRYLNTDIIVMVTPDAYAKDSGLLEKLVAPIIHGEASIAYARQLPHDDSDFFEAFSRTFNYPEGSHIRSIHDVDKYGVYTFFCSNSCAAYSTGALEKVGGFPSVLLGEDTVTVARLLKKGHRIAYVAEAEIQHSHRYSLRQEFQRNFDTGLARREYGHLLTVAGSDSKRGRQYVQEMLRRLIKEYPSLLPYACVQILVKWVGYKLGQKCVNAPVCIKKRLSSQDFYWVSDDFLSKKTRG